jgi:hypothetical protein|tara:strand:+ start:510 stop:860 length:351 start_codon:yes stop_codon:yes gene_type:complete
MYIIRHPSDISGQSHLGIGHIILQRISELRLSTEETLTDIGEFIIVEPGDTISSLEEASGCPITTDLFGDAHYGPPDFVPSFEWLERHNEQQCFEMVFIMTDDGYFMVLVGTALWD